MPSFSARNVVLLCSLFSLAAQTAGKKSVFTHRTKSDLTPALKERTETGDSECQCDAYPQETSCYCGPNSKGCKIENGKKICECNYPYRQENGICKARCHQHWRCANGGKCVNGSCQCLPGTSGDFCGIVDACDGDKGPFLCGDPKIVLCRYDTRTRKPYCMCRTMEYAYYSKNRTCLECHCGDHGTCSLVDGKKQCKCNEGAALRKVNFWGDIIDNCDVCNCGQNSESCSFEGLHKKVCKCKNGYAQQPDLYGDMCNPCDCGPHGRCHFNGWYKYCNCDQGYKPVLIKNRTELTCLAIPPSTTESTRWREPLMPQRDKGPESDRSDEDEWVMI